jgi:hypothetical protein
MFPARTFSRLVGPWALESDPMGSLAGGILTGWRMVPFQKGRNDHMTRRIGWLAAVLLALAACSSSTPSGGGGGAATPDPIIAFCDAIDSYGATLVTFDELTPSNTVDEYKAAGTAAKAALAVLLVAQVPFAGAQVMELGQAQAVLNAAVDELPPNATPAMAELALDPAIKDVQQQLVAQRNAMCNTRPTPSSAP